MGKSNSFLQTLPTPSSRKVGDSRIMDTVLNLARSLTLTIGIRITHLSFPNIFPGAKRPFTGNIDHSRPARRACWWEKGPWSTRLGSTCFLLHLGGRREKLSTDTQPLVDHVSKLWELLFEAYMTKKLIWLHEHAGRIFNLHMLYFTGQLI